MMPDDTVSALASPGELGRKLVLVQVRPVAWQQLVAAPSHLLEGW